MKIRISQRILNKALNNVSSIATGKNSLPILNNVLIRVDGNKVSLTTTNLDMAIVEKVPCTDCEDGAITVPARLLTEFISNLPKDEFIELSAKGDKVVISAGEYVSTINSTSADDYPDLPEPVQEDSTKYVMGVDDFKSGISQVIMASSNDTTRPVLTGVYFNTFNNSLYLAATDGYRLAERKFIDKVENEIAVVVPTSSLQEVMRTLSDDTEGIEIIIDDSLVQFCIDNIVITSKLINGSYPDYRQLLPKQSEVELVVKHEDIVRVTKLAALFAREVGGSITFESIKDDSVFKVASVANELGENSSVIKTEVNADCKVTLNSRFVLDALNAISGKEVAIGFSNSLDPIVIKDPANNQYVHIVMPLRG